MLFNRVLGWFKYIYIYIYEMGSSYTWCNFIRVTPFLDHWFAKDLMVKNSLIIMSLLNI